MKYKDYYTHLLNELTPDIDLVGKTVMADKVPLKTLKFADIEENIIMFRDPSPNSFFGEGFTLVYFMDSKQSAIDMKDGKIPYLRVPQGTFHSGGSPITDIWKRRFQKPGTEHILGVLEGWSDDKVIYLDMLTVRPKYQKNTIARRMVDIVRREFPSAKIKHSDTTSAGGKFMNSYKKDIPPEQWIGEK